MTTESSIRSTTSAAKSRSFASNKVGIYSIEPIAQITGALPTRQQRLVEAWAELYQAELLHDWHLLQDGRKAVPITPLS